MTKLTKIKYLLDSKEKKSFLILFFLMAIAAFFETLGVGLIMPFIALLQKPSIVIEKPVLNWIYTFFGFSSYKSFLLFAGILFVAYFFVKGLYLIFVYRVQLALLAATELNIAKKLFEAYVHIPFSLHIQQNSSIVLRNIMTETRKVVFSFLMHCLDILLEFLVVIFILILLIVMAPIPTLATILILSSFLPVFYKLVRHRLYTLGKIEQRHLGLAIKGINQAMGGFKEMKVLGRESFFVEEVSDNIKRFVSAHSKHIFINKLPHIFLEIILIGTLIVIVGLLFLKGQTLQHILPLIGLFALASIRLMPSVSKIMTYLNSMKFTSVSLEVIYKDLKNFDMSEDKLKSRLKAAPVPTMTFNEIIKLERVSYRYPGTDELVLKNIQMRIHKGESVALVGHTGSGKTTLVDLILGLLSPTQGQITVDGLDISSNMSGWQQNIGYVPQFIYLIDDTIKRNIAFGISENQIDEKRLWWALGIAQLVEFVKDLPRQLDTIVGEVGVRLSGGQRQRIGIARAIYNNPELLVLDEATSSLDRETEEAFSSAVERLKGQKTFIIIAHRISTVKYSDCIYLIDRGIISAQGSYEELIEKNVKFQRLAK